MNDTVFGSVVDTFVQTIKDSNIALVKSLTRLYFSHLEDLFENE